MPAVKPPCPQALLQPLSLDSNLGDSAFIDDALAIRWQGVSGRFLPAKQTVPQRTQGGAPPAR